MSHVKYKKPRAKKVKPPAPIKPAKPARPKRTELRKIYKELLSADRDQRVTALAQAMSWYDKCLVYVHYKQEWKWTTAQLREKNRGEKARASGIASNDSKKKELEFTETLKAFEKVAKDIKPPSILKVLSKLNKEKPKLEARKKKLHNKFGEFLQLISTALNPKNADEKSISLYADKLTSNFRISSEGNVTLDRKFLGGIRSTTRKQGLLAGTIQLLPVLSEAGARIPEVDRENHKTGKVVMSYANRYRAVMSMIENLFQYAIKTENPKKLVRRIKEKKDERQK